MKSFGLHNSGTQEDKDRFWSVPFISGTGGEKITETNRVEFPYIWKNQKYIFQIVLLLLLTLKQQFF